MEGFTTRILHDIKKLYITVKKLCYLKALKYRIMQIVHGGKLSQFLRIS